MRIIPKQLLHGLFYLAPVTLLALASCGGGGGGGGASATLASYQTLSINVTGVAGVTGTSGVVLRNGGDNLTFSTTGTQAFGHQVLSGSTYNISVLTQPSTTPNPQICTFASNSKTALTGVMPASAQTFGVNCVTGYTIGGTSPNGVTGLATGASVVLQNNGSDNLLVTASGNFTFSTPVTSAYDVTVLTQPAGQTCTISNGKSTTNSNVINVLVACVTNSGSVTPDQHVYVANSGDNTAYTYAASGVLTTPASSSSTGSSPSAIAVYGGKYAFVTNRTANTVSAYSVTSGVLSTSPSANVTTGTTPFAIAIHPSGKFAYVVNEGSNSISAYSIDPNTGKLASIDADGGTAGLQTSISTGFAYIPVAITIDPAGTYAYVASLGNGSATSCGTGSSTSGCITAYQIDSTTGALTLAQVSGTSNYIATGQTPSSIAVDGINVYVTNQANNNIGVYPISSPGKLNSPLNYSTGTGPTSIAINPVNRYAYVTNTTTNDISVYNISTPGFASPTTPTGAGSTAPVSVSVDSTGQYAYVANSGTNNISVFQIIGSGATLTSKGNFSAGLKPVSVTTAP